MTAFREVLGGSRVPAGQHPVHRRPDARLLRALLGVRARRRADDDDARVVVRERAPLLRPDRANTARSCAAANVPASFVILQRINLGLGRGARRAAGHARTGAASREEQWPSSTARRRHRSASVEAGLAGTPANLTRASGNVRRAVPRRRRHRSALRETSTSTRSSDPRSVAVIGASDTPRRPTTAMTRKIQGVGRALRRHDPSGQPEPRDGRRARRATRRSTTSPATSTSPSSSRATRSRRSRRCSRRSRSSR